jgi:SAM-dependent methyltransferase
MGKSDPYIFQSYRSLLPNNYYEKVALLGNQKDSNFTSLINCKEKDFYDLALENWDINDDDWNIDKKYDLVVSTRCPYFAKDPKSFIDKCLNILNPGGILFLDWGLGDHWRFERYKIGWLKDGEHEFAYKDDNFLWSTIWHDSFLNHPEFIKFQNNVEKFGYNKHNIKEAIFNEVPSVLDLSSLDLNLKVGIISLWEDNPQIYFLILIKK